MGIFTPSNLDLDELLKNDPSIKKVKGFHKDKLAFAVHVINEIPAFNKDIIDEHGFVPVNAEVLQYWICDCYSHILKYLVRNGVLETDNYFLVGKKSRSYRIAPFYRTDLKEYVPTNFTLRKKLKQKDKKTQQKRIRLIKGSKYNKKSKCDKLPKELEEISKPYKAIEKWYNTGKLQINYRVTHAYNSAIYNYKLPDTSKWDQKIHGGTIILKDPYHQYIPAHLNIEKIKNQEFNCHSDYNVMRQHSTVTYMKKELRNGLTYDGKKMVCIDIANSQPYLLTLLLNPKFWSQNNSGILTKYNIPYFHFNLPIFKNIDQFNIFITLINSSEMQDSQGFQQFKKLVTSGEFYKAFGDILYFKTGVSYTKKELKPIVFQALFTDNRFIGQADAEPKRLFKAAFPEVYEAICHLKKHQSESLPIALQRIESYIIYQVIVNRISEEHPEIPLFPIHDGIATTENHQDYVTKVMEEELAKAVGLKPVLNPEYWDISEFNIPSYEISKAA